jgi:hypothetical protein
MGAIVATVKEYATLIKWLVIVAAVLTFTWFVHHDGTMRERGKWEVKEAALKLKASKQLSDIKDANAKAVETLTAKIHDLEVQSATDRKNTEEKLAAARKHIAAAGGLHDPGRRDSCSRPAPEGTTSASGSDGEAGSKLSDEATEFLSGEASRADAIVLQLDRAQLYITELEQFINATPKAQQ